MKTTFPMESRTSPAPGIIPEPPLVHDQPASRRGGGRRAAGTTTRLAARRSRLAARRSPLARLMAALHGDKYMVDAYPPAGSPTRED